MLAFISSTLDYHKMPDFTEQKKHVYPPAQKTVLDTAAL